jgi:pectinesterase
MTNVRKLGILFGRTSLVAALFALALSPLRAQTNLSVAPDGSAQFKSVQEAIMAVPSGSASQPVVIHIKPGTYKELIYIQREKRFFRLVGDNATNTVLTYDLYANLPGPSGKPIGTFRTPSTISPPKISPSRTAPAPRARPWPSD